MKSAEAPGPRACRSPGAVTVYCPCHCQLSTSQLSTKQLDRPSLTLPTPWRPAIASEVSRQNHRFSIGLICIHDLRFLKIHYIVDPRKCDVLRTLARSTLGHERAELPAQLLSPPPYQSLTIINKNRNPHPSRPPLAFRQLLAGFRGTVADVARKI